MGEIKKMNISKLIPNNWYINEDKLNRIRITDKPKLLVQEVNKTMDLKVVGIVGSPRRGCQGLESGLHIIHKCKIGVGFEGRKNSAIEINDRFKIEYGGEYAGLSNVLFKDGKYQKIG